MKNIHYLFALLFLGSCAIINPPSHNTIEGKYLLKYPYEGATLELKEDSSFSFCDHTGLFDSKSSGTWSLIDSILILQSFSQPLPNDTQRFSIFKLDSFKCNSLKIELRTCKQGIVEPLAFATCSLKKDGCELLRSKTDLNGIAILPKVKADSLLIKADWFPPVQYPLDDSISAYGFTLNVENLSYVYFTSEKWLLKDKKLFPPESDGTWFYEIIK